MYLIFSILGYADPYTSIFLPPVHKFSIMKNASFWRVITTGLIVILLCSGCESTLNSPPAPEAERLSPEEESKQLYQFQIGLFEEHGMDTRFIGVRQE